MRGDDWPAWARQRVELAEPDPTWPRRAADLARDLDRRLRPWLDGRVAHVGSTAVPGLVAKPVLDLLAPVASLAEAGRADDALAAAGWQLVPPALDGRAWRRLHVLAEGDRRLAHLHLVEPTHPRWDELLAFRDRLRADPALAAEYARVKRRAAEAHADDREAYTEAKAGFVRRVVAGGSAQRDVDALVARVVAWAEGEAGVRAVGLAGSWARGDATAGSDVDLVVLVDDAGPLLATEGWLRRLGEVEGVTDEDWGRVRARRVRYLGGPEVELGLADPGWAAVPVDEGTARVVRDGLRVLHDPDGLLRRCLDAVR